MPAHAADPAHLDHLDHLEQGAPAVRLWPATAHRLLHRVATEQAAGRAPSLVAAVARDGRMVWAGSRGRVVDAAPPPGQPAANPSALAAAPAGSAAGGAATPTATAGAAGTAGGAGSGRPDGDTQYRIGSITKTFTAVLVMRLRDEGRLALGDPVERHLPGTAVGDRTIAQLLSHLGGVAAETPAPWWERVAGTDHPTLADALGPAPDRHRPGRRHHYSNVGFAVLGEMVARLRGTSWAHALHREILAPLEMDRTTALPVAPHAHGWAVHPHADVLLPEPAHDAGVMAPAGQLWSTTADLVRWSAVLAGHTDAVLAADTLAEMREPAAVEGDTGQWRLGAGLGVQLLRHDAGVLVGHGGSMPGFVAALWTEPAGTAAVALANATSGVAVVDLAVDLIDIVETAQPRLPAEWAPAGEPGRRPPELELELTGTWYWGPAPYTLSLRPDGGLLLAPQGRYGRRSRFQPGPAAGTWTGLDGYFADETLTPHRHLDGTLSHLDLASFVLTRTPYDPAAPVPGGVDHHGWRGGDPPPLASRSHPR